MCGNMRSQARARWLCRDSCMRRTCSTDAPEPRSSPTSSAAFMARLNLAVFFRIFDWKPAFVSACDARFVQA